MNSLVVRHGGQDQSMPFGVTGINPNPLGSGWLGNIPNYGVQIDSRTDINFKNLNKAVRYVMLRYLLMAR